SVPDPASTPIAQRHSGCKETGGGWVGQRERVRQGSEGGSASDAVVTTWTPHSAAAGKRWSGRPEGGRLDGRRIAHGARLVNFQTNALFACDALRLAERLPSAVVTLAYLDPPWNTRTPSRKTSTATEPPANLH